MWSVHEQYRNHFLQTQLKHLEPQKINEMVDKEVNKIQSSRDYCNKLDYLENNSKSTSYFNDRAVLPYGFWALPKLMKDLNSDNPLVQWKAINSLSDYIVNPLYAQRAITQFDITRRCQNVFLRIRMKYREVRHRQTARLLVIFYYIATHRNGALKILENNRLLDQFYTIVCDREVHLEATSKILPYLSDDNAKRIQLIDDYKVFDKLTDIWNQDPCIAYYPADLWLHLTHILEVAPEEAIKRGFFEIVYKRITKHLLAYHIWDMKCFGLLLRCQEGQKRFLQVDGVKVLYTILNEEILDDYENVIFALMHGLFAKASLYRCREFTNFPLILTKLAKESMKCEQQLFCFQALREMGAMPVIKRFIKENCYDDIRHLEIESCRNERERKEIVYWLERETYHTSNLREETEM